MEKKKMKETEYNVIRGEMLQNFRTVEQLLVFSITVVGGLFYWLVSEITTAESILFSDPFIFVIVGLIILSYAFSRYLHIIKRVYNQGSYLVAFHEISSISINLEIKLKEDTQWHYLSRKYTPKWGIHGRIIGGLLIALIIGSWAGPIFILYPDNFFLIFKLIFTCKHQWITFSICVIITIISFVFVVIGLFKLESYMKKNMCDWIKKRDDFQKVLKDVNSEINKKIKTLNEKEKEKKIQEFIIAKNFPRLEKNLGKMRV